MRASAAARACAVFTAMLGLLAVAPATLTSARAVAPVADAALAATSPRSDIWQTLRTGRGYAVLLRHALAPGTGDPPGFRLGDCSTQRNLSAEGRAQAVAIGAQWRRKGMPVERVLTSRWCRARDTARLLGLGKVSAYSSLDSSFTVSQTVAQRRARAVSALIAQHRQRSGVLVLVGHQVNIADITGVSPVSGGAVVVKARPDGTIRVVGTLPPPA